jgi:alanyl-tRNA synthetase
MLKRTADPSRAATLLQHATAFNALDATHRPHVTMLQRCVRTADLSNVYETARKALTLLGLQS